jgi:glyoxylase I family protein
MSLQLKAIHHAAIICSNYEQSKHFYTKTLGLPIIAENYRAERSSYKLDLAVGNTAQIELFSFASPPARVSRPEAAGLRHLAFVVEDINKAVEHLAASGVSVEPIRTDEYTGKKFTFFADPDELPLELYEMPNSLVD